jgi:hypothetical protein
MNTISSPYWTTSRSHWNKWLRGCVLAVYLGLFASFSSFGQVQPPNDDFTNSTLLTGTDVTFSGTLAGATLEGSQEFDMYFDEPFSLTDPTQSVWWTWTAPTNTGLTLQILSSSLNASDAQGDELMIYYTTNGTSSLSGLLLPALAIEGIYGQLAPESLSVPVNGGTDYHIQLIGNSSGSYTFRLIATNTPIILQQPRSQAVYSNASALFYVVYAGVGQSTFTFQWLFNGTNLAGETAPMLALTNIAVSMAGDYSVIVSNSAGLSTINQPATLIVSQSNVPSYLAAGGLLSNSLVFSLTGENGRSYRIQSSTNLANWVSDLDFPIGPFITNTTSVVINTNSPLVLMVTNNSASKFFRATPYVVNDPDAAICINNLREIRVAKLLWQRDNHEVLFYHYCPDISG